VVSSTDGVGCAQKGKLLLARGKVNSATLSRFQEQYGGHPLQLRLHPSAKCGPPQAICHPTNAERIDVCNQLFVSCCDDLEVPLKRW